MKDQKAVREWHIVVMGFLQKQGAINGMVQVWQELQEALKSRHQCRVELRFWDCNMSDLAELISKLQPDDVPPRICLYGYSWGGMSACNLARELRRRGLRVDRLVLCDAVYRHWYPLGYWRAFAPWRSIRVPDNVHRVTVFRQRESLPRGHSVTADNPGKTLIDGVHWLKVDHCWMDDQSVFHSACRHAATGAGQGA